MMSTIIYEVMPREVWIAAAIIVPITLYSIFLLIRYWLRWKFALPSIMFEQLPFREAMKRSEQLVGDRLWRLGRIVYLPLLAFIILGALLLIPFLVLSNFILQSVSNSIALILLFTGIFVLFNWLLTTAIGVIGTTIVPVLTASLYHDAHVEQAIPMRYEPATVDGLQFSWSRRRTIATVLLASLAVFAGGGVVLSNAYEQIAVVPTVTAHRGSSAVAPPNTLASVQQAIDDGADYAEIDVQETADGVIILNHDKDYLLAAGNDGDVHELTLAETKALDVGTPFSADFAGESVPTLAEVLALAKDKIKVNIELKYYGQDVKLAERVVADVRETGMVDEVVIMSLHFAGVEDTQRFAPEITTGFLVSDLTLGDETALDVDFLAVSSNLATPKFVRDTHASGKELYVWTINDAESVDTFLSRGVDSIITDYPVMVREQILEREALSSTEKLLLVISDLLSQ